MVVLSKVNIYGSVYALDAINVALSNQFIVIPAN